jgi:hypothetical protein
MTTHDPQGQVVVGNLIECAGQLHHLVPKIKRGRDPQGDAHGNNQSISFQEFEHEDRYSCR